MKTTSRVGLALFEKGTRKDVNNIWPISIVPSVAKILEKVILTINSVSTNSDNDLLKTVCLGQ